MLSETDLNVLDCLMTDLTIITDSTADLLWCDGARTLAEMSRRGLLEQGEWDGRDASSRMKCVLRWNPGEALPTAAQVRERISLDGTSTTTIYRLSSRAANLLAMDYVKTVPRDTWDTALALDAAYAAFRRCHSDRALFHNSTIRPRRGHDGTWQPDALICNNACDISCVIHSTANLSDLQRLNAQCLMERVPYELW